MPSVGTPVDAAKAWAVVIIVKTNTQAYIPSHQLQACRIAGMQCPNNSLP